MLECCHFGSMSIMCILIFRQEYVPSVLISEVSVYFFQTYTITEYIHVCTNTCNFFFIVGEQPRCIGTRSSTSLQRGGNA